ncbi:MAG TPA: hypothetical protein VK932_09580 [Kofleriaceae bacterium]|nr:hypothetical protein [Kofleriaceae bacterium]
MKTFSALLLAALLATTACKKKEEAKTGEPAKTTEPTTGEPAKTEPTTPEPPKAEPAAGGKMTVDEAGAKATAMMDKVGVAITSAGTDCAKMGANLKELTAEVKTTMESGKHIDEDPAMKKEFEEKYGSKMMKQMEGWGPALEKCKDDAEVKAFFTAME